MDALALAAAERLPRPVDRCCRARQWSAGAIAPTHDALGRSHERSSRRRNGRGYALRLGRSGRRLRGFPAPLARRGPGLGWNFVACCGYAVGRVGLRGAGAGDARRPHSGCPGSINTRAYQSPDFDNFWKVEFAWGKVVADKSNCLNDAPQSTRGASAALA